MRCLRVWRQVASGGGTGVTGVHELDRRISISCLMMGGRGDGCDTDGKQAVGVGRSSKPFGYPRLKFHKTISHPEDHAKLLRGNGSKWLTEKCFFSSPS